jgi:hypothetical protein
VAEEVVDPVATARSQPEPVHCDGHLSCGRSSL